MPKKKDTRRDTAESLAKIESSSDEELGRKLFAQYLEEYQDKMEILKRHCNEFGRDAAEIEVTHNTRVVIGATQGEFDALAAQGAADANVSLSAYKESLSRAIAGTPEQCIQQLARYVDSGIRYFFLLFPDPISSESLELFAREVMRHFATADG